METARDAVIAAGQWEQALADTGEGDFGGVTDAAAQALAIAWNGGPFPEVPRAIEQAQRCLEGTALPGIPLTVRTPEGFAFYALFPEQFADAALVWNSAVVRDDAAVLVVGIRSIGTTLSAVVKAALSTVGWRVRRCTVRPMGDPFQREVQIPVRALEGVGHVLVTDEGPGLSGSSMAAVVFACKRAGFPRSRIVLMPSHSGKPGMQATGAVRTCWETTPIILGRAPDLPQRLAVSTARILGMGPVETGWLGGGNWRRLLYPSRRTWPAVCPWLEREKLRCSVPGGKALLWKFAGFPGVFATNAKLDCQRLETLHRWTVEPMALRDGFVATRWVEGTPARRDNPRFLDHAADYVIAACDGWLDSAEAAEAHIRLAPMIADNTGAVLGAEDTLHAMRLWEHLRPVAAPRCGDPRMLPHEWLTVGPDRWIKTDCTGHRCDHTLLGSQPVEWGIAAACHALRPEAAARLFSKAARIIRIRWGYEISSERWRAYRLAHTAFRIGEVERASPEPAKLRACNRCARMLRAILQEGR